jgi:DNA invertase Pin-like site-specific DNA recombinase
MKDQTNAVYYAQNGSGEQLGATIIYKASKYIRLSYTDDKENESDSVANQRKLLDSFIESRPDIEAVSERVDDGVSGVIFDRPAFKEMMADIEAGKINCVIVKDLSRFGRSAIDTGYYIEKYLPSLGVRFIAVGDDFDSLRDMDNGASVILPLKNMINEAYALDIGRKIRAQQNQAMKSGEFVGSRPPYGYVKAPDNCHKLIVDPEAAEVVRLIFGWAHEKAGINTIARRLNEMEIEPPNIYSQRKGIINFRNLRSNHAWQTFAVSRILADEAYIGDMVQGKTQTLNHKQVDTAPDKWITVRDTHEPLVSREVFAAVREYRSRVAEEVSARAITAYTQNIFKGKIFCGHCGMPLHRQRQVRRKSDDVYMFHCLSNSRKARGSCESFTMPEGELTAVLLTMIRKHAETVIGRSLKLRETGAVTEIERSKVKAELAALRQEADKGRRMLKSLYESLVSGLITADEYREMRDGYEAAAQANLARACELEHRRSELERQTTEYFELSALMESASENGITGEIVGRLVDRIKVYADRHIEVEFRFESGFDLLEGVTGA